MKGYLSLLRPANVVTALGDVLAGFAVAGLANRPALPWLLMATACLYAGGVVLNDYFDRDVDRVERPERPIPSGRVPAGHAAALGAGLLAAGVLCSWAAGAAAGLVGTAIASLVLLYDAWGKRHVVTAPLNMGLCRALNLLLGMAAVPAALTAFWPLALIPLCYIWAVTALSRGEVHGGDRRVATAALSVMAGAVAATAAVTLGAGPGPRSAAGLVLALFLAWRVVPPFVEARRRPSPGTIRVAVMRGVLSLVLLNAAFAATYAGPVYAGLILLVGVAAGALARAFAVT